MWCVHLALPATLPMKLIKLRTVRMRCAGGSSCNDSAELRSDHQVAMQKYALTKSPNALASDVQFAKSEAMKQISNRSCWAAWHKAWEPKPSCALTLV